MYHTKTVMNLLFRYIKTAESVGCAGSNSSSKEMVECMREIDAMNITIAYVNIDGTLFFDYTIVKKTGHVGW